MTVASIRAEVAGRYRLLSADLQGARGSRLQSKARGEAMAAIRQRCGHSWSQIGREFGVHRTSVQAACKRWEKKRTMTEPTKPTSRELRLEIGILEQRVRQLEGIISRAGLV